MVVALNTASESFKVFVSDVRIIPKYERPVPAEVAMKTLRAGCEIGRATSLPEKKTLRGSGCHRRYRCRYASGSSRGLGKSRQALADSRRELVSLSSSLPADYG